MRRLAALIALAGCADYPYAVDEPACSRQTSSFIPLRTDAGHDRLGGYACVPDEVDLDPLAAGTQANCTAELWVYDDFATSDRHDVEPVPACADPVVAPCWRFHSDPVNCGSLPDDRAVELCLEGTDPRGRVLRLDCEMACEPEPPTVVGGP